jgi:hypothetical protein
MGAIILQGIHLWAPRSTIVTSSGVGTGGIWAVASSAKADAADKKKIIPVRIIQCLAAVYFFFKTEFLSSDYEFILFCCAHHCMATI